LAAAAVLCLAVGLGSGCGGGETSPYRTLSGLDALPDHTLEDWVSYSDAVVVAEIVSEDGESELSPDELASGEGLTVRYVTARVGEVVWTQDDVQADAVPRGLSIDAPGWLYSEGNKTPYVMDDGIRLEVGESFLMPIAEFDSGGWGPIGFGTPVRGEQVSGLDVEEPAGQVESASSELSGMDTAEVASELAATPPDPVAAENADLDPLGRYRAVAAAEMEARGALPPAPGEK
jgi:hypothetical protein